MLLIKGDSPTNGHSNCNHSLDTKVILKRDMKEEKTRKNFIPVFLGTKRSRASKTQLIR